jgi:hypothetical protein
MKSRTSSPNPTSWVVAAVLALGMALGMAFQPGRSSAQDAPPPAQAPSPEFPLGLPAPPPPGLPPFEADAPLFRDPGPDDGPRIMGPILQARPPSALPTPPPPPSALGPFQALGPNAPASASAGQPILAIPPSLPPLPAGPEAPTWPDSAVGTKRSTQIGAPHGFLGDLAECFLWGETPYEYVTLPSTLLWKPPVTNLREPQFYGIFHDINGQSYIDTAIGAQFGLGRIAPVGKSDPNDPLHNEGIQLDVFGAVFTRFDQKRFLTAIDYRAGIPLTYKKGPWSTKLSYEHTSTHLGDEYIQAYNARQVPLVLDEAVYGLSRYFGEHVRLYGQIGYAFNTAKETNANRKYRFDWGINYKTYTNTGPVGRPYLAYDMDLREYQNYVPNNSFQVGWQWVNQGRSVRLALQVYEGKSMFGQFYTTNERWVGFGGYYDF